MAMVGAIGACRADNAMKEKYKYPPLFFSYVILLSCSAICPITRQPGSKNAYLAVIQRVAVSRF
jgi:hypothetical protein